MCCSSRRYHRVVETPQCSGELLPSQWGTALPHFCFIFPVSFETQEKTMKYPSLSLRKSVFMKYKRIWKFRLVWHNPINAALHWFHIHFLWQGTNWAHRWTNATRDVLPRLPHHPSTANTFIRKGPQDVPRPWSPFDCNGTGPRSNWPQSVKAAPKLAFTIVLLQWFLWEFHVRANFLQYGRFRN